MSFTSVSSKRISTFFTQVRFGSTIRALLIQNLVNRGSAGEIVTVKRGFFRNLLYPRKIAVYNTPINLEKYQYLIKQAAAGKTSTVAKATVTTPVPEVAAVETAAVEQ